MAQKNKKLTLMVDEALLQALQVEAARRGGEVGRPIGVSETMRQILTDGLSSTPAPDRRGARFSLADNVAHQYQRKIPTVVPPGMFLVHNHVRPARRQGTRGFRFWLQPTDGSTRVAPCDCGWAPELSEHYHVLPA